MTMSEWRTRAAVRRAERRYINEQLARVDLEVGSRLDLNDFRRPSYEQVDLMLASGVPVQRGWLMNRVTGGDVL